MAKINWTEEAEDWLKRIYDYIAQDNRDAAMRLVRSMYKRVKVLKDFPLIGQRL
ncbi:MAG TPA: type II toxin-antitoxin system RelE/ParE family toxin [Nitrospirota bacterium]|nr:type II toxin-antitoxin system RelE/ParE family toxin [Nitrospirota bacterium]